jgi:hypothetical protein
MLASLGNIAVHRHATPIQGLPPRELVAGLCLFIVVPYAVFVSILILLSFT